MFGFDGETEGFISILKTIEANDKSGKLTHKEIRAYARCMLALFPGFNISTKSIRSEIKILLACLSASGIPHYDRSFLASRILKLLEDEENTLRQQEGVEEFF